MRRIKGICGIVMSVVLLFFATKEYLGYHYFYKYYDIRGQARSIESSFPELEGNLKKAVRFYSNPVFYKELARLYLERAVGEAQFGTAEERDFYVDQMRESLIQLIKRNPIDAYAYYEMGKVYLLYNFPLLTYIEKAKLYFQMALELNPVDEFLNIYILYIYLTQWDFLNDEEKSFVYAQAGKIWRSNESFIPRLRNFWRKNGGDVKRLKEIFSQDEVLWAQISKHF